MVQRQTLRIVHRHAIIETRHIGTVCIFLGIKVWVWAPRCSKPTTLLYNGRRECFVYRCAYHFVFLRLGRFSFSSHARYASQLSVIEVAPRPMEAQQQ